MLYYKRSISGLDRDHQHYPNKYLYQTASYWVIKNTRNR